MVKIKLMPDYHCYPLWGMDDDNWGNIRPSALPISKALAEDLMQWAAEYDATLNGDDPLNSSFSSAQEEWRFKDQGEKLLDRLRLELGNNYTVVLNMA